MRNLKKRKGNKMKINEFIEKYKISMKCEEIDDNPNIIDRDWCRSAHHWKCQLSMKRKRMTVIFSMGQLLHVKPNIETVVDCLIFGWTSAMNNPAFKDWCSEFGYDIDSIKAYKLFQLTKRVSIKFEKFIGKDAINDLENYESL